MDRILEIVRGNVGFEPSPQEIQSVYRPEPYHVHNLVEEHTGCNDNERTGAVIFPYEEAPVIKKSRTMGRLGKKILPLSRPELKMICPSGLSTTSGSTLPSAQKIMMDREWKNSYRINPMMRPMIRWPRKSMCQ